MKRALSIAADLCRKFEGFRHAPYLCPAGVATVAYGSTRYPDGKPVTLSDPAVTLAQGEEMLIQQLQRECLPAAVRMTPGLVDNEEALGAIADFIYNLGASRYKNSTLRRRLNAGEWEEARHEIRRWIRTNGRILRGLVRRREAEAALLP